MSDPFANDRVFCPATLKLGEIHWYLLRAANLMLSRTTLKIKAAVEGAPQSLSLVQYERTSFGKEVGLDEINWWIFKKETDIEDLRVRTQRALGAAQTLKDASAALSRNRPKSYDELLTHLRKFAEDHVPAINALYDYVRFLSNRNVMAPSILYTYRVWGSTRRSDRWIDVDERTPEADSATTRQATEAVLGLTTSGIPASFRACYEVGEEIWSSGNVNEEGIAETIPLDRVVLVASRKVYHEGAIYFTEMRDSLRNIQLDIEKFVGQRDLVNDDAFWREFVKTAALAKQTEGQLWDFKETLPMWHVSKSPEREDAKVAFAEDVASLANARGAFWSSVSLISAKSSELPTTAGRSRTD